MQVFEYIFHMRSQAQNMHYLYLTNVCTLRQCLDDSIVNSLYAYRQVCVYVCVDTYFKKLKKLLKLLIQFVVLLVKSFQTTHACLDSLTVSTYFQLNYTNSQQSNHIGLIHQLYRMDQQEEYHNDSEINICQQTT